MRIAFFFRKHHSTCHEYMLTPSSRYECMHTHACATSPQVGFICNRSEHWFALRRIGPYWFDVNSTSKQPKFVSDTYLSMVLAQVIIFICVSDRVCVCVRCLCVAVCVRCLRVTVRVVCVSERVCVSQHALTEFSVSFVHSFTHTSFRRVTASRCSKRFEWV